MTGGKEENIIKGEAGAQSTDGRERLRTETQRDAISKPVDDKTNEGGTIWPLKVNGPNKAVQGLLCSSRYLGQPNQYVLTGIKSLKNSRKEPDC